MKNEAVDVTLPGRFKKSIPIHGCAAALSPRKMGSTVSQIARRVLGFTGIMVFAFAVGNASGLYFYPRLFAEAEPHDDHEHADDDHDHDEEPHIALTQQAYENLNLRLGKVTRGDYWHWRTVPG